MVIISLSTIPSRFGLLGPTLESLLAQTARIDEIRVTVPRHYHRFPDHDGSLPQVPDGVTVRRCEMDLGPATKILPCARDLRRTDATLLLCDDDRIYPADWAKGLLQAGARHPDKAICVIGWPLERWGIAPSRAAQAGPRAQPLPRWADWRYRQQRIAQQIAQRSLRPVAQKPPRRAFRRSGLVDIFGGYGGVLLRPDWFDDRAFDIPPDVWAVDDIWLSGTLARRGVGIWAEAGLALAPAGVADRCDALFRSRIEGRDRDTLNRACIATLRDAFGIWS